MLLPARANDRHELEGAWKPAGADATEPEGEPKLPLQHADPWEEGKAPPFEQV